MVENSGVSVQAPGAEMIGKRVSIRLFLDEGGFQDLLGILESARSLRKRDGSVAEFDPGHIFVWREVISR